MAEKNSKSAEEQLRDGVWNWVLRLVVAGVLIGAGVFIGYVKWGDATELRTQVAESKDRIVKLENERETVLTQKAKFMREYEVARRDLKTCKADLQAAAEGNE